MKNYNSAISWAIHDSLNMPDHETNASKFIVWAEDICGIIAHIYEVDYEKVVEDFQEALGISE
jgi:Ni,Fe-hydrogenase III large subunit